MTLANLALGMLLRLLDVFQKLLFLRVVGILFQQLFPGLDCAFGIALALPANDAEIEECSRMIGLILQRSLKFGDGSIGVTGVPERSAQIGEQIGILGLALGCELVIPDCVRVLPTIVVQVPQFDDRVKVIRIGLQGREQRRCSLIDHFLLLFGRELRLRTRSRAALARS